MPKDKTPAKYNFKAIEEKWQREWEKAGIFRAKNGKGKKFYVLEMYPYPSASGLHLGHTFNYLIGDVYARFKRMQGFNVLYPMGYDSFGLPAENSAIKEGIHPKKYTDKAISNFMKQQKSMGFSYDWSRILWSHSPEYYKWNQFFFLKLLEKELAYRKKSPVNFCRKCNTVLANEQVHNGKCWRHPDTEIEFKNFEQWFVKTTAYADELLEKIDSLEWAEHIKVMQKNWIGKSFGYEIDFEINGKKFPVFTTRPDTIFGVSFLVISTQHPQLNELVVKERKKDVEAFLKKTKSTGERDIIEKEGIFTGSYAINPANNEKIPVWVGNFVVAEYGSGIVMGVPAHDSRDFEFVKKYNLPIKPVILKKSDESYSFIMGIDEGKIRGFKFKFIEKTGKGDFKVKIPFEKLGEYKKFIIENMRNGFWNEFSTEKGFYFIFKHKNGKIEELELNEKNNNLIDKYNLIFNNKALKKEYENVYSWLSDNKFYKELLIHQGQGILVNSGNFNGLFSEEAKEHILKFLESKKSGRKSIQYKMRDWLISRQRYWGTPIPIIYCDTCGIVPVPKKELPVLLPEKVKFGKGNPLETSDKFVNAKCPKCSRKARRETDTMDTFFDSSWYYLRFCDNENNKIPFDKKKVDFWMPVNQYIGGAVEHACMHLIYARFFTKFLRDSGFLDFDEPFKKLFGQGLISGEDGYVMSKSRGNVIDPLEISRKYSIDSLRMFLVSVASLDKNFSWSSDGFESIHKFIIKIMEYFENIAFLKDNLTDSKTEHKIHKSLKEITGNLENFQYNSAIIKIRELFNYISKRKISKRNAEIFLKLLSVFCPHISEEIWKKIGNKSFISKEKWILFDKKKINENFDKQEEIVERVVKDVLNILKIVREKTGKECERVFLYVIPNEKSYYDKDEIGFRIGKKVEIYSVNETEKYDPEGKSKKAKPGKPGIYIE